MYAVSHCGVRNPQRFNWVWGFHLVPMIFAYNFWYVARDGMRCWTSSALSRGFQLVPTVFTYNWSCQEVSTICGYSLYTNMYLSLITITHSILCTPSQTNTLEKLRSKRCCYACGWSLRVLHVCINWIRATLGGTVQMNETSERLDTKTPCVRAVSCFLT